MIRACIFDMDGTVADTLTTISYFANSALAHFGLPPIERERYRYLIGNGAALLVRRMLNEVRGPEEIYDSLLADYNSAYDSNFLYLTEPYEGIIPLFDRLKAAGIRTAIVSNKPDETTRKISRELFGDRVDYCRGAMKGVPLKPSPEPVIRTMEALDVRPEECLYIGDTATDMETGRNAGIVTIGVLWGFRGEKELREAHADMIVSSPAEIFAKALGGEKRE